MIPAEPDAEAFEAIREAVLASPLRLATNAERAWLAAHTPRGTDWDALLDLLADGGLAFVERPGLEAPVVVPLADRVAVATPEAAPEVLAGAFAAHLVAPGRPTRRGWAAGRLHELRGGLAPPGIDPSWAALGRWRLVDDPDRVTLGALLRDLDGVPVPHDPESWRGWLRLMVERRPGALPESFDDAPVPTFSWRGRRLPRVDVAAEPIPVHALVDRISAAITGDRPVTVGVIGAAASGKSTLCARLARSLVARGHTVALLGGDRFLWPGEGFRYDVERGTRRTRLRGPAVYDHAAIGRALRALRGGHAVRLPADPHEGRGPAEQPPAHVIVTDGVCIGYDPEVRDALDVLVALHVHDAVRLERKWRRDAGPRGTHRRDVVRDFVEKQLQEVTDGILPVVSGDVTWVDASEGIAG